MKSIDYPGAFLKIGGSQEEYHTVHAMPLDGQEGEVVAIYELTEQEIAEIVKTKRIIYSRLTFGNQAVCKHCNQITPVGFQPFSMSAFPVPFKAKLDFSGELREVDAFIATDGVQIPGYSKTPEGKFVKNDPDQ